MCMSALTFINYFFLIFFLSFWISDELPAAPSSIMIFQDFFFYLVSNFQIDIFIDEKVLVWMNAHLSSCPSRGPKID